MTPFLGFAILHQYMEEYNRCADCGEYCGESYSVAVDVEMINGGLYAHGYPRICDKCALFRAHKC